MGWSLLCVCAPAPASPPRGTPPTEGPQGPSTSWGGTSPLADSPQQRRRTASPRDSSGRSSSNLSRGDHNNPTLHGLGSGSHQAPDEAKRRDDERSDAGGQDATPSRDGRSGAQERSRGARGKGSGVEADLRERQQQQQQQPHHPAGTDVGPSTSTTSGGGGWLGGRIRWAWERQGERQSHALAGSASGKKARSPSVVDRVSGETALPGTPNETSQSAAEHSVVRRASSGTVRFPFGSSRSSSDATGPPSVLDPNWEAHADLIRAAFAQHLEQLCR